MNDSWEVDITNQASHILHMESKYKSAQVQILMGEHVRPFLT